MANTKSAKKAARQAVKRTEINKARKSRMRTFIKKVEDAIAAGNATAAAAAMQAAEPVIMRTAQKGLVHKNAAARKVSRLAARLKVMASTN
jgi:small subunit ribosomal protein S20